MHKGIEGMFQMPNTIEQKDFFICSNTMPSFVCEYLYLCRKHIVRKSGIAIGSKNKLKFVHNSKYYVF